MRTYRILVLAAEQDSVIEEVVSYFSALKGYEVVFVQNGLEAIDAVKKLSPDVVVMELLLPKLDGIRICKALKSNKETSSIPIIIVTLVNAEKKSLEAGADIFILKPVQSANLIDRINDVLHKQAVSGADETAI
ncbi:MAG TPA: response regulator [Anaerolineae bacterium]|nr:response regulator [Anaerolineae bacterium]